MTIAIENQQRLNGIINYDTHYINSPHFTNPWNTTYPPSNPTINTNVNLEVKIPQPRRLPGNLPHGSYSNVHISSPTTGTSLESYTSHHFVNNRQDLLSNNRSVPNGYEQQYSTAPSPIQNSFSANQAPYEPLPFAPSTIRPTFTLHHPDNSRRISQPNLTDSRNIHESIDANRGMIAMNSNNSSQNSYGHPVRIRASGEPYQFTGALNHSTNSSLSSSSPLTYYGGSVDSSMGDYTCNGLQRNNTELDKCSSRTLPRPPAILGGGTSPIPPAPQSMMGQFSSKITSNTTKKHKCKVCDKRFTRPSSLQTHMYSHTGEKPFVCNMGGCGRQFSVVSNLRRHQKVHKNETRSEAGSEGHHSD
ncbi:hypothetical protein EPUL_000156, partial [Erysiphe pulchra]